jgi:hypothetical protein
MNEYKKDIQTIQILGHIYGANWNTLSDVIVISGLPFN